MRVNKLIKEQPGSNKQLLDIMKNQRGDIMPERVTRDLSSDIGVIRT